MTSDELDRLEELANAATPGPWVYAEGRSGWGWPDLNLPMSYDGEYEERNAQYIAALHPGTALALIFDVKLLQLRLRMAEEEIERAFRQGFRAAASPDSWDAEWEDGEWYQSESRKTLEAR